MANARPEVLRNIATLGQVTLEHYEAIREACLRRLNSAIRYAVHHRIALAIRKLDAKSVRVVGYLNASFANNQDLSTLLGCIVLLDDSHGNSASLIFKLYKSRRITRFAMAGKVVAFAVMSSAAVTLLKKGGRLLNRRIPLQLLTNSRCFFDVISKG